MDNRTNTRHDGGQQLKNDINVLVCGTGKTLMCHHWSTILYNSQLLNCAKSGSAVMHPMDTCSPYEMDTLRNALTFYLLTELCLSLSTPQQYCNNRQQCDTTNSLMMTLIWNHSESNRFVKQLMTCMSQVLLKHETVSTMNNSNGGSSSIGASMHALRQQQQQLYVNRDITRLKKIGFDEDKFEQLLNSYAHDNDGNEGSLQDRVSQLIQRETRSFLLSYISQLSCNFGALSVHYRHVMSSNDQSCIRLATMMKKDAPFMNTLSGSFEGLRVNVREYHVTASQYTSGSVRSHFEHLDVLMYCVPLCQYMLVLRNVNQLVLRFKEWETMMSNRNLNQQQLNRVVLVFNTTEMFKRY